VGKIEIDAAGANRVADVLALAKQLAGPIARGRLPAGQATAALFVVSLHLERAGLLGYDAIDVAQIAEHIAGLRNRNDAARRETTEGAIRRVMQPLLGIGARSNRLRAAAHDENGAAGFPLSEAEVEEIALTEAWQHSQGQRASSGEERRYG
jgi:hypothetical protein